MERRTETAKSDEHRIMWRERGAEPRAYGDFRDFADVGGKREALVPDGARRATTDKETALVLIARRVEELQSLRRQKLVNKGYEPVKLKRYAADHLDEKAKAGKVTERWLQQSEHHLARASAFFGPKTYLHRIDKERVKKWIDHQGKTKNGWGGTLSDSTIHHHLSSLSNLYRRASSTHVPPGFNPVSEVMDKPAARSAT